MPKFPPASQMGPVGRACDLFVKRALDVAAAGTAMAMLALPFAAIGVAIKLESPGPIFYRGGRIGLHGKEFQLFKFRSMRVSTGGPTTTSTHDPRITKVGAVLRRFKLDELPQLINVLLGEMSLVGPRPQVAWCVARFTEDERAVLEVRPGITDWASMKFHNEEEIIAASGIADADAAYLQLIHPEKTRLQLAYVRSRNVLLDLRIIADTVRTLVRTRSKTTSPSAESEGVMGGAHSERAAA